MKNEQKKRTETVPCTESRVIGWLLDVNLAVFWLVRTCLLSLSPASWIFRYFRTTSSQKIRLPRITAESRLTIKHADKKKKEQKQHFMGSDTIHCHAIGRGEFKTMK